MLGMRGLAVEGFGKARAVDAERVKLLRQPLFASIAFPPPLNKQAR